MVTTTKATSIISVIGHRTDTTKTTDILNISLAIILIGAAGSIMMTRVSFALDSLDVVINIGTRADVFAVVGNVGTGVDVLGVGRGHDGAVDLVLDESEDVREEKVLVAGPTGQDIGVHVSGRYRRVCKGKNKIYILIG